MKIEATCDTCSRRFLLSQIGPDTDSPGRCPFCGARFARHYNPVLIETVGDSEKAAAFFVATLGRLQAMETGFDLDLDSLLETVNEQIRAHETRTAAPQ